MDVDRVLPGQRRDIGIGIADRAADGDAGVVDEDVETPKVLCHVVDELFDLSGRRLVGLESAGFDALGLQFGHNRLGFVGGGDITDGDVGAFIGEGAG